MNGKKSRHDSEIVPTTHEKNLTHTDTKIDSLPPAHHTTNQPADTNCIFPLHKDACHMIGWAVGVVLALLVAIVIVNGVIPDVATLGVMMPVMLGSALAAMASLV